MYHTIILVGNLGRDPEMRYTPGGQTVTNFSVAVDDSYTASDGNRVERTIWFRISTWGRQAEICNQYLRKGSKVLVEGRMVVDQETGGPRVWEGQSGFRASFEVNASTVRFLSSRAETEAYASSENYGSSSVAEGGEEDIPF